MVKQKNVPLWVTFLFAGFNVVVLAYLETYVSPQLSSAFYSLPIDLLIIASFLLLSNAPKKDTVKMITASGVYGQIGAIITLLLFIYLTENEDRTIILAVAYSLFVWSIYNYFFIYLQ